MKLKLLTGFLLVATVGALSDDPYEAAGYTPAAVAYKDKNGTLRFTQEALNALWGECRIDVSVQSQPELECKGIVGTIPSPAKQ